MQSKHSVTPPDVSRSGSSVRITCGSDVNPRSTNCNLYLGRERYSHVNRTLTDFTFTAESRRFDWAINGLSLINLRYQISAIVGTNMTACGRG